MKALKTTAAASIAVLALAAALSVPALAMADDTTPTPPPSTVTTPAPAPHPGKKAIAKWRALANKRMAAFNVDANLLRRRINRLQSITTLVAKLGGDVSAIRSQLTSASTELYESRQEAIAAASATRLVPFQADRASAEASANAQWKAARAELKTARADKLAAGKKLWALVKAYDVRHVSAKDFAY